MATIVTRSGKGSPLTNNEVDANFNNLNSGKAELSGATFTGAITANAGVVVDEMTLDADTLTATDTFTIDAVDDITLNSDNSGRILFGDASVIYGIASNSSSNFVLEVGTNDKDMLFKGQDGGSVITALTLNMSDGGNATFNKDIFLSDNSAARFGTGQDLAIFHDGSNSTIRNTTGDLTLDVAGDIVLDADGGDIFFKDNGTNTIRFNNTNGTLNLKTNTSDADIQFQGNDGGAAITALQLDMSQAGRATFNEGIVAKTSTAGDYGLTLNTTSGDSMKLSVTDTGTGGGADGIMSVSDGDLTLDVAGNIVLDADGGGVYFKDAGINIGFLQNSGANDFRLVAGQQDKDIVFMGNDGGSAITALTLDMSAAGAATFNSSVTTGGIIDSIGTHRMQLRSDDAVPELRSLTANGSAFKSLGLNGLDLRFFTSSTERLRVLANGDIYFLDNGATSFHYDASAGLTINEAGDDRDFRVESDAKDHALFLQGSSSKIGINQASPAAMLDIVTVNTAGSDAIRIRQPSSSDIFQIQAGISGATNDGLFLNNTNTTGQLQGWKNFEINFNDDGVDRDFRVESNDNANMFFVDGGNNHVGVGRASPASIFEVHMATNKNIGFSGAQGELGSIPALVAYTDAGSTTDIGLRGTTVRFASTNQERMRIDETGVVVNDGSHDADFRIESNGNANMLFVDGGTNRVGIGRVPVGVKLDILGGNGDQLKLDNSGERFTQQYWQHNGSPKGAIWVDSTDAQFEIYGYAGYGATIHSNATERANFKSTGEVVFNDISADYDFRIESNGNANMFFVNGGVNKIGMGRSANLRDVVTITGANSDTSFGTTTAALEITNSDNSTGHFSALNFRVAAGNYAESLATVSAKYSNFSGNVLGQLSFGTRGASSTNVSERMRIDEHGGITFKTVAGATAAIMAGSNLVNGLNTLPSAAGTPFVVARDSGTTRSAIFGGGVTVGLNLTLADGNLVVANGHGVDFSATGNSGGSVQGELLDDYERGTFTPVFTTDGTDFSNNSVSTGQYSLVGNQCTIQINCVLSGATSGGTGNVLITGLPFTCAKEGHGVFAPGRITLNHTLGYIVATNINATTATVACLRSQANPISLLASEVNGNGTPFFSTTISYRIA